MPKYPKIESLRIKDLDQNITGLQKPFNLNLVDIAFGVDLNLFQINTLKFTLYTWKQGWNSI